jgi:hypothetical protein
MPPVRSIGTGIFTWVSWVALASTLNVLVFLADWPQHYHHVSYGSLIASLAIGATPYVQPRSAHVTLAILLIVKSALLAFLNEGFVPQEFPPARSTFFVACALQIGAIYFARHLAQPTWRGRRKLEGGSTGNG